MTPEEIGLRLSWVSGLGASLASELQQQLIDAGGEPSHHLRSLGLNARQCRQFNQADPAALAATLAWLEAPGRHMLTYGSPHYPPHLHALVDAPFLLLVEGCLEALQQPQIAMVGSRNASHYGARWGHEFAVGLVQQGYAVISGLALGVDGICHRGALAAQGTTLAVLGSGLANIYPSRHRKLAAQIVAQGGALISEYLVTAIPLPAHFPRRNRIISGLGLGVLVVEAAVRSGSLITARLALDQGRDVFALPGALGNPMSAGPHWLIQQGAHLVTQPQEIAQLLGSGLNWLPMDEKTTISSSDVEVELPFADVLANVGDEVTPVDVVAERAGQPVPEVVMQLLELELAGWIAAVPGGYVRIRRASHVRRTHVLI